MKKNRLPLLAVTLLVSLPAAANPGKGAALYKKECTACHGSEVFTRPDRRVTSLTALNRQVRQCNHALEKKWFDEDINAVVSYLNQQFYKF